MKEFASTRTVQDMMKLKDKFFEKFICIESKNKIKKRGRIYLMCPFCYSITPVRVRLKESINISNPKVQCFLEEYYNILCCKEDAYIDAIELDYYIGEAISILNKKGYKTKFCCEGHGNDPGDNAYIYFKDNNILKYIDYLPITWYIELDEIKNKELLWANNNRSPIIIRSDFYDHDEAMDDILEFAIKLPNIIS